MTTALATSPQLSHTSWGFAEGDEIAPGRTTLKRLGGGRRYDAYLGWDDHLHSVVVFKVVRPHLVENERVLAGLREEWAMINRLSHPVILRGFDAVLDGPRPTSCSNTWRGRAYPVWSAVTDHSLQNNSSRSGFSLPRRSITCPERGSSTWTSSRRTRSWELPRG